MEQRATEETTERERLPGSPAWMDLEEPPACRRLDFTDTDPVAPGWISHAAEFENSLGHRFSVRASVEDEHQDALEEYEGSLHLMMLIVDDIPELQDAWREIDRPSEKGRRTVPDTARVVRSDKEVQGALIVLETDVASAGNSVVWAAKWSTVREGDAVAWRGDKQVRMAVAIGYADLRGIAGNADAKRGGQQTGWRSTRDRHCAVYGYQRSDYRLTAGWHR